MTPTKLDALAREYANEKWKYSDSEREGMFIDVEWYPSDVRDMLELAFKKGYQAAQDDAECLVKALEELCYEDFGDSATRNVALAALAEYREGK